MKRSKVLYNRIKAALAEAGVSGKELADALGVTEQTVSAWCTNTKQPSLQTLYLIADYLKIDVRDLLVPNKHARSGK
jgi:transcriptional regulator with XRE-family HTH domain